jgi:ABC-type spermidine/putrescine transport system permease subunit I
MSSLAPRSRIPGARTAAGFGQGWIATLMSGRGVGPALPALVYLVVFLVIPLGFLFSFAFLTVERSVVVPGSLSLSHFAEALGDDLFWKIAWRSFWVGALSTFLCLLLGYPVAYIYTRLGRLQQKLLLIAVVAPLLTSALVRTYAWIVILGGRRGLLNTTLINLDLIDRPLRILNTDWAVLIGMTQIHLPFMILPLIAVLIAREAEIENASLILGASRVQTFFRVTLPLSVPGITAGVALVFAISYTNFIIPQLLGGGNYTTLAVQVYEFIVVILDWTKGAVRASLLLLSCFAFVLLITWTGHRATRWSEGRAQ